MVKNNNNLTYCWLLFAASSLIVAGIFAFLVALARMPFLGQFFSNTEYIRIALVGHVNLAFIIWFLSFQAVLWTAETGKNLTKNQSGSYLNYIAFFVTIAGTILITITTMLGMGTPLFTNYVPVVIHPLFFYGLVFVSIGIGITAINTLIAWHKNRIFNLTSFGIALSAVAVITALLCFGISYFSQNSKAASIDLESLFWGGGHILQFANTIAMIAAWLLLSKTAFGKLPVNEKSGKIIFLLFLPFIILSPFIYLSSDLHIQRDLFTKLMQLGIGFPTIIFVCFIVSSLIKCKNRKWGLPEYSSLILSLILFTIGSIISFTINGSNTKIPSHYHGVIGAVTISFMGVVPYFIKQLSRNIYSLKMASIQPYFFGAGQILFVFGMFLAGAHGVSRKTFGAAQNLDNIEKIIGMSAMGIGGIIAIIGGILFIINTVLSLTWLKPLRLKPETGCAARTEKRLWVRSFIKGYLREYLVLFKIRICTVIAFSAVTGLVSAAGDISFKKILLLIIVTMSSATGVSAFNNYFDRDIDTIMDRTKIRPTSSGTINKAAIPVIAFLLVTLAMIISIKFLNFIVALHLLLGGFTYAIVYTVWLKRRSWLNIIIGGLAGSFAVLAGGASAKPEFCLPPIFLSLIMFFWTPTHFWTFAIAHKEEYKKANVPMLPVVAGNLKTAKYVLINSILLVISSFLPIFFGYFGPVYIISAILCGVFIIKKNLDLLASLTKEVAWTNFKASMVYLSGIFIAVLVDVILK